MKETKYYIFAFILPILIFSLAMFSLNLYPFGEYSIRISDALSQYSSFFEGLRHFHFFTFNIGLGFNFYSIFTTYLNNPLNIFYLLFKKENFDLFFALLILFKIGLIGLTMNFLLNYKKEYNKKSIIFSTIYTLSGFVTCYHWNYQFLDALYMLPLIMIGIDKIVNEDKNIMYYLTLTYMIIIHYYTAYMICIFSVIYFFFLLYNSNLKKEEKKKRTIKFFVTSLFCGLTAAYILIPTIYSLFQGRQAYFGDNFGTDNFAFINKYGLLSFYKFAPISQYFAIDVSTDYIPAYISIFVIFLLFITLINKNENRNFKKSIIVIIIIYFLSTCFNHLYIFWHLFQLPFGLPGRFVFCFNAFWVLISYQTFLKVDSVKINLKNKYFGIIFLMLPIFIAYLFKSKLFYKSYIPNDVAYIISIFLTFFLFIFYAIFFQKKKYKYLLYFFIFVEIFSNNIWDLNMNQAERYYNYLNVNHQKEKIKIINDLIDDNNDFTRAEILNINSHFETNEDMFYNINGVSYYSSLFNYNINNFLKEYNLVSPTMKHKLVYKKSILMDSLLGLSYFIYFNSKDIPQKINNEFFINSLGFAIKNNNNLKEPIYHLEETYEDLTEYKLSKVVITPKVTFNNVEIVNENYQLINKEKDGKITIQYFFNDDIICQLNNFNANNIEIYYNQKQVDYISSLNKGDNLKIEINMPSFSNNISKDFVELICYTKKEFEKIINELNNNSIYNIKTNLSGFTGNITTTKDKNLILLTIPYSDNIIIKIDGQKYPYEKYLDGIIGLSVNEGEHYFEFIYKIKGLKLGIILSITSFVLFIIYQKKFKS